jgi:ABC-type phosphate/phosphonate transport system substrate-binding protein
MRQVSQRPQNVCPQTALQTSQAPTQEIDELLYQASKLADQLPTHLTPLVRESLAANLTALVEALRTRGVEVADSVYQDA